MRFNTALLHDSFNGEKETGATLVPVYNVNAYAHESAEKIEKIFNNKANGYAYTRISNPTTVSFESRMTALEHGLASIACSSGMAAVTMSLINILESGDEIVASGALYGGTLDLFEDLESLGITARYIKDVTPDSLAEAVTDKTKAVFTEVIGNPKLNVVDLKAFSEAVHSYDIPLIADSTTATPYLCNPIDLGADIVVHSTSKYINGSSNAISGIIVDSGNFKWGEKHTALEKYRKFGKFAYIAKLRNGVWRNVGACVSPNTSFLNSLGLETLGLRMERLCSNALALAEFLEKQNGITVNYPALPSSPYYDLVHRELKGKGGAIITIRTGSKERAFKLINSLRYASIASNIGDVRTLVIHPSGTLFAHSSKEAKEEAGVYEDTIRISVGIEDIEDIISDFAQAIEKMEG
ncbi:MAG: O-acetylhomoserine aminocarboxypropyltransferase/cysteine synthase family protein [Huintestinicola sp.]